ncbi:LacI family DNA-binding transcriptional regulator [Saccharophagus degradans]|uniref:Transcriptional regulator, LacI family n=2 Tax=Saccharophagus degradans TaxID=86304 RepID=Q21G80_SACD2|nr:LacI family DNA-binding transcriptional regulator [Saccharophagus degradans]ABD82299.1 transcriptional regulator, LacI family [Saccharophagus degradans 2-40]MDO6421597.1 LacI family DNA-binding transcriptional regulator [Saccharophagus degradans]MDO6608559.1 LacI family DNA-binding transcriptional regulator [Saccharophagus degradans]WGO99518.1 LacI family DNA-binding transcriptional regulator [Saccharophagus degradans]
MKPTIKDVAKLAGVSFKTVSRVVNKESTVGEALQEKVWKAINELGYKPNLSARGLRGAASSIGFIYDNPNSNYVIDMQRGILNECHKRGYELVIHPCNASGEHIIDEVIEMIDRSRVGGLVLTPPISENPEILAAIANKKVEFVRILSGSAAPDTLSPCVYIDDRTAAYTITQHLIDLNHKDIAFLGGDEEHKSSGERLEGYRSALADNGITPHENHILPGKYSFESGVERTRALLELDGPRPTAVFACNDEIAAGTLFAARIAGVDVPNQLSIVGFEDSPFSRQAWPNLTTAQQPTSTIAQRATALLIDTLKSRAEGSQVVESEGFLPKLIVRDSSQTAPV